MPSALLDIISHTGQSAIGPIPVIQQGSPQWQLLDRLPTFRL